MTWPNNRFLRLLFFIIIRPAGWLNFPLERIQ
jgi:hypothetical protein